MQEMLKKASMLRTRKSGVQNAPSRGMPHAVPAGKESVRCPITGTTAAEAWKAAMDADPDIRQEGHALDKAMSESPLVEASAVKAVEAVRRPMPVADKTRSLKFVALDCHGSYHANSETRRLVRDIGSVPTLQLFTENFYEKVFTDAHIDQFIADHSDPHGFRFACWIAEKMGDGTPWTKERRTRPEKLMRIGNQVHQVAFDRSSAHFAAWHSPKRSADSWGQHFKLEDSRNWMRLHFWAAREVGMFECPEFMDHYIRLIGHFVSVYSREAPAFTRDSARWSADPANIKRYLDDGRLMTEVVGKPYEVAVRALPQDERAYTGSKAARPSWPYDQPSMAAWLSCNP